MSLHYFQPQTLAIVHIMALGWGTMIILGASHQLLPTLIEGRLGSNALAYLSFGCAAAGIPLLASGFYFFQTGWPMQAGAILVNTAIIFYFVNVAVSIYESPRSGIHAIFMLTAAGWLLATALLGLLLVFNFSLPLLPRNSVEYLALHAHLGIAGWFLLLVLGVASRLIPMFLISKYENRRLLWTIYTLLNLGLLTFIVLEILDERGPAFYVPVLLTGGALGCFGIYCRRAFRLRLRKQVDGPVKLSLLSVMLLLLPVVCLLVVIAFLHHPEFRIIRLYGFCIFFGWLTAIILGMTFKTLPFIVWNKVYHLKAAHGKTPAPKELFSESLFRLMSATYLAGFGLFIAGMILLNNPLLLAGAAALLLSALSYAGNVARILFHKPASA
jgi:hypothetical protein